MKRKAEKNYYAEIDSVLTSYENYKSWHEKSISWICDRIDWCWKFKHITREQMEELVDRVCKVLES